MQNKDKQFFKEMASKDLLSFCVYTDKFFSILPHHELIAEHLEKMLKGDIQKLLISMPPRAGKSRLMEEFVAFILGKVENQDILCTGHTVGILEKFSRHIRDRLGNDSYKNIFNTNIKGDNAALKSWGTDTTGVFSIYGVGGSITGEGGDWIIVDDPYATRQDAESSTVRKTVSDWYWSTLLSRVQNDKAKQIIIMQRWREDDLAGEILEVEGDEWVELKIPALNEEDESFWPDRFSSDYYKKKREQNPIFFSSQYQQNPINEKGGTFTSDYFTYYNDNEYRISDLEIVTFIDPAISTKQEADQTAIVTIGLHTRSNMIYILEVKAFRAEPDEIINEIFRTSDEYHPQRVGVEVVAYQKMLALEIQKQMRIRNKYFVLEEINPMGEKEARIKSILQPRYANGSILHNQSTEKIGLLETELLKFPKGKHDDIIDALSGAVKMLDTYEVGESQEEIIIDYSTQI